MHMKPRNMPISLGLIHSSVADPDPFDTDPDPVFQFDTDPDPYCFQAVM
jgi:hypothetical protein